MAHHLTIHQPVLLYNGRFGRSAARLALAFLYSLASSATQRLGRVLPHFPGLPIVIKTIPKNGVYPLPREERVFYFSNELMTPV